MRGFILGTALGLAGGVLASTLLIPLAGSTPVAVAAAESLPAASVERPAYMLVLGKVNDRAAFGQGYAAKLPPLYDEFGGSYLAIGRGVTVLEGDYAPESFVVGQWPSKAKALEFWNSDGYDVLRRARIDNNWGDFDVLLVEGLPAPATAAPAIEADPD
ncbi:MAG: DUF1330 domain-containing protein [Parvularculaceae bacterium]|nr:DUF1330 domain-containing protein [Parvularculaceae bacterium]